VPVIERWRLKRVSVEREVLGAIAHSSGSDEAELAVTDAADEDEEPAGAHSPGGWRSLQVLPSCSWLAMIDAGCHRGPLAGPALPGSPGG
jgi:hypothetical protein